MTELRILGQKGRTTIPYAIRKRLGFRQNDVLSFTEGEDGCSVLVRREKLCDGCADVMDAVQEDRDALFDFLDGLSPKMKRDALVHLSVVWAGFQDKEMEDNR